MTTIDLLRRHRSIRRFEPDPIPSEDIRVAVAAGQAASTSSAIQAYCLLHVTSDKERARLAELTGPQEKVARCGAFFVVCGDVRRHRIAAEAAGHAYDARLEGFLLAAVDATLFAQNLVIAFESMGYGICYIGGLRNRLAEVDRLLEIPHGVYPLYGLCVGTPAETPDVRPRLPVEAVLFEDRCPDDEEIRRQFAAYDETYRAYLDARGATPRAWSEIMGDKFRAPRRTNVAAYYRSKGARFD